MATSRTPAAKRSDAPSPLKQFQKIRRTENEQGVFARMIKFDMFLRLPAPIRASFMHDPCPPSIFQTRYPLRSAKPSFSRLSLLSFESDTITTKKSINPFVV